MFTILDHTVQDFFDFVERNGSAQQCLTVSSLRQSKDNSTTLFDFTWNPVECNKAQQTILCEIRVETVTYAWVPNWMAIVLIILTITSLFALCVGAMCITSSQPSRREKEATRANGHLPNDLPPKYSDVVVINESTFDKYKNKGKELLAKIYIVRE